MGQIREIDLKRFVAKKGWLPCCFEEMNQLLTCMQGFGGVVDAQCMEERKSLQMCMKRTVTDLRTRGKLNKVDQVLKVAAEYGLLKGKGKLPR